MDINHANIFYARNIHAIGGVETFVYELAKKYKDYDIAVVCKTIEPEQRERLRKFCRVYIHKDQKINCKVIITNWDTSILDYVNENAKKYTVIHTDYSNPTERKGMPEDRPDITYIGITESSKKAFENISKIDRTILCRNPYEQEKDKPILTLLSATRLTDIKDGGRMLYLANTLERLGINFIWYIVTTNEYKDKPIWQNKNVVYVHNRLDVTSLMKNADWYVQLSICEGDSYSLREALYRGLPIVVCELPYFKEVGIEDNKNALFYNKNNSNAEDVAIRMKKPLKFTFNKIEDGYNDILDKAKSNYEEERNMKVRVECIKEEGYKDIELRRHISKGEQFITNKDRAEYLEENNAVKIIEEIKENKPNKEDKKIEEEIIVEKPRKKRRTSKTIEKLLTKDI